MLGENRTFMAVPSDRPAINNGMMWGKKGVKEMKKKNCEKQKLN